jgi:hypothetical protein
MIFVCFSVSLVLIYIIYKFAKKQFLKYQANKDRSYNVFDKAEFTNAEKA